jgi:hypothetical protein
MRESVGQPVEVFEVAIAKVDPLGHAQQMADRIRIAGAQLIEILACPLQQGETLGHASIDEGAVQFVQYLGSERHYDNFMRGDPKRSNGLRALAAKSRWRSPPPRPKPA